MMALTMETKVEIENLGELIGDLKAMESKLNKQGLAPILRPGARVFQRAVKAAAPKKSGLLKRSIRVKLGKGKSSAPYASMFVTFGKVKRSSSSQEKARAYYAMMVHNGTRVPAKTKRRPPVRRKFTRRLPVGTQLISPRPFVYDAFEANVQAVADKILNDIASLL